MSIVWSESHSSLFIYVTTWHSKQIFITSPCKTHSIYAPSALQGTPVSETNVQQDNGASVSKAAKVCTLC